MTQLRHMGRIFWRRAWFDTVGSRVIVLMLGATVPLALIAGTLAAREYLLVSHQATGSAIALTSRINGEIERDVDQSIDTLTVLSQMASDLGVMSGQFSLLQSVSTHRYCLMALQDRAGATLAAIRGTSMDGCPNGITGQEALIGSAGDTQGGVIVVRGQPLSIVRLSGLYKAQDGQIMHGQIIGIRPLGWQNDPLPRNDVRHGLLRSLAGHAWFLLPGGGLSPIVYSQADSEHPDSGIIARLQGQMERGLPDAIVYRRENRVVWTAGPGFGAFHVLVARTPSTDEAQALRLFIWRVFVISTFLALELVVVAIAAHAFLVDPMETLAQAVREWRRGGVFEPDLGQSVPAELLQLERAMRRATARIDRHERRLRRAARNQDLLIREIHHRVKNNLQVVASLLNLQASRIRSSETREEFRLVRDRIRALATLHRYLYADGGVSQLDVRAFMTELCNIIFAANGFADGGRVRLDLKVEAVPVSPDQAVPLALIVTEILTNALRHAYPDDGSGQVSVRLEMVHGEVELAIADNGIGLDTARVDAARRPGIGLRLIKGFATQIRATLDVDTQNGTRYCLRFAPDTTRKAEEGGETAPVLARGGAPRNG